MRNFQNTFKTRKRSFISAFSICMTVPLRKNFTRKEIQEFKQFKNHLIQKAQLKGIQEKTIRNSKNFFLHRTENPFNLQPQHSFLKILKKRLVLSLYWFATQRQSSIFRRQKIDPLYLKFRGELNEFVPRLQKQQEEAQKLLKARCG